MLKNKTINIGIVEDVAIALEEINNEVVFVGGAVVSLYATDVNADEVRPTKDIDISVEVSSYKEMDILREKLSTKRIYPASDATNTYRYNLKNIIIDFIPTGDTGLGPTNSWLTKGFYKSITYSLNSITINILPVEYFLAAKWEAHKNRGKDERTSPDFEDIIYVIDNNADLIQSFLGNEEEVKKYLQNMAITILNNPYFEEIIEGHLNPFTRSERKKIVGEKLSFIAGQ